MVKGKSNWTEAIVSDGASDAECVQRVQEGESEAFETLVRRHQKTIFNLVYRMLGDYDEAAEMTQETFLSAYRSIDRFRGEANFSTWLYRIAINHATTRRKSVANWQQRSVPLDLTDDIRDRQLNPEERAAQRDVQDKVQSALNSLDPEDATVILLRDLQDTPYEEVAKILDIPLGTVKSRLHRARQELKARLAPHFLPNKGK